VPKIKATPHYGAGKALVQFAETLHIEDDLPADVIGEVVAKAIRNATRNRYAPIGTPFSVVVTISPD
jgi:hypothetical protein